MKPLKSSNASPKASKEWHTSPTQTGMGDYYGSGIKNKVGKIRFDSMSQSNGKVPKMKNPAKSMG